jgi:ABC-2 type transport system ATP-binding protein
VSLTGQYASVDEDLTGHENLVLVGRLLGLAWRAARQRAAELLDAFGLAEAAGRQVLTYSGGERRRIDIAASLVAIPEILFLDEPTTGLDPRSRTDLWGVISQLVREGTTVLLTTQYLEEADLLADRIVVIDRGQVIAQGTSSELKATIGETIIEIDLADAGNAQRARAALAKLGMCDVETDGHTVELKVNDGSRAAVDVVRTLDREGLEPVSLVLREPTLDDVFLTLTGHAAEEPVADEAPAADGRDRGRGAA